MYIIFDLPLPQICSHPNPLGTLQLTDLWCQEQHLSGGKKLLVTLVLDGLDRGPGKPIMSQSMRALLSHCYPGCEKQWQAFESDKDESSNLILQVRKATEEERVHAPHILSLTLASLACSAPQPSVLCVLWSSPRACRCTSLCL